MATKVDAKGLDNLINQAAKKVNAKKDNDICRFIPGSKGGYIHHFTMRKMKTEAPEELQSLISKYIINCPQPINVPPKRRAARGSRKRRDQLQFSRQDLERMLQLARQNGDKYMVHKLTPKRDLRTIKRELIVSIRHGRVDQDLWNFYSDAIAAQQHASAAEYELANA